MVKVFEDRGISGSKGRDKRPGFDAMLKAAVRREFDMLAVWSAGSSTGLMSPAILTAPWDVVRAFGEQWTGHDLLGNILSSLQRAVLGLTFGVLGGTSILIVVGVALDTMRQMEAQLMMRQYEGFLK